MRPFPYARPPGDPHALRRAAMHAASHARDAELAASTARKANAQVLTGWTSPIADQYMGRSWDNQARLDAAGLNAYGVDTALLSYASALEHAQAVYDREEPIWSGNASSYDGVHSFGLTRDPRLGPARDPFTTGFELRAEFGGVMDGCERRTAEALDELADAERTAIAALDSRTESVLPGGAGQDPSALYAQVLASSPLGAVAPTFDQQRTAASIFDGLAPRAGRPPAGADPHTAALWWSLLTPAVRREVVVDAPDAVGNLDGLPFAARDEANRVRLRRDVDNLTAELARLDAAVAGFDPGDGKYHPNDQQSLNTIMESLQLDDVNERRTRIRQELDAMHKIQDVLTRPNRSLLTFQLDGKFTTAAVGINDVDHADNVSVFVPGMTTTVASSLKRYDGEQEQLLQRTQNLLDRGKSAAAITWIGYRAPQWGAGELLSPTNSVVSDNLAKEGAKALVPFLRGVDEARANDPHLTVLAHSYGSTTAGIALQQDTGVDDVVLFGSPGAGTDDGHDLHVSSNRPYVIEAEGDYVADAARFGSDPNHTKGFTGLSALKTVEGTQSHDHSHYLDDNSTSQHNMALVVAGKPQELIYGDGSGKGDTRRERVGKALEIGSWAMPGGVLWHAKGLLP